MRKKVLQILLSARAHAVKEVFICKDMIIQLDTGKRVSVGQYIVKCPKNEDFYINELDKYVRFTMVLDNATVTFCPMSLRTFCRGGLKTLLTMTMCTRSCRNTTSWRLGGEPRKEEMME